MTVNEKEERYRNGTGNIAGDGRNGGAMLDEAITACPALLRMEFGQ